MGATGINQPTNLFLITDAEKLKLNIIIFPVCDNISVRSYFVTKRMFLAEGASTQHKFR
jgi:hypothetical protein